MAKNNTEPKQVNHPVKVGCTAFWSALQLFCHLSLSKKLFTTGAFLASGRAGRSVGQTWTPPLDCFTAGGPGATWVRAGFALSTRSSQGAGAGCSGELGNGLEKRAKSHCLFFPGQFLKNKCELREDIPTLAEWQLDGHLK